MTVYIDASIQLAVRQALAGVRDDVLYAGGPDAPAETALDEDWIPVAGKCDWTIIMRDKKIRTKPAERQAFLDAGVRAFCLTNHGNATRWGVLELLVTRWRAIEREVASRPIGPYFMAVTQSGITDITNAPWGRARKKTG